MALVEFYMQSTGSNLNAGSTTADAAAFTYASGNLATVSNVATFTPASGNPLSDGVQVGDRVSIYVDGDTATPFVGLVTGVTSTTITCATNANRIGTIPADGTGNRSLKVGGAWADFGLCATGRIFAANTQTFAWRVNIKTGTYANGTTSRTIGVAGTTTIPIVWRGYKTAIGDLDTAPTSTRVAGTDIPSITFGDANLTISGGHHTFENIDIVGARSAAAQLVVSATGAIVRFKRCRVENTNAAAASSAVNVSSASGSFHWLECWFKATSSATRVVQGSTANVFLGCNLTGGGNGFEMTGNVQTTFHRCIVRSTGSHGIQTVAPTNVAGCSFYSCGGDSVRITTFSGSLPTFVINNVFSLSGGYDINNSSGTNTNFVTRMANVSHSPTSGHENGFGDSPAYYAATDSASPYTAAGSGDFSLAGTSNANDNASPHRFENDSNVSHASIGAVQPSSGSADYPAVGNVRSGTSYASGAMVGTLTVPAAGDVQSGVTYGAAGTEYTGTFASPAVGNVRSGVGFGAAGTEFTGTLVIPAAGDVQSGVMYGAVGTEYTGNFASPAAGDVRNGIGYGAAGTEFTGTFLVPAVADVQSGVTYGAAGIEFTGAFATPGAGNVRSGVGYGAAGTEFTGTCSVPAAADVRSGVAVDAGVGTLALPAVADVQSGVSYGAAGVEFAGILDLPAAGNVRSGTGYGAGGVEFAGNLTVPGVTEVRKGTQYGAAGTEFSGTFIVSINLNLAGEFSG